MDYLHGTPLPLDKPQAVFGKAKPAKSEKKMPAEGKRKVEKKVSCQRRVFPTDIFDLFNHCSIRKLK